MKNRNLMPWLCLLALLTIAAGVDSLFRHTEWDSGATAPGAVWTQDASKRSGSWSNLNFRYTQGGSEAKVPFFDANGFLTTDNQFSYAISTDTLSATALSASTVLGTVSVTSDGSLASALNTTVGGNAIVTSNVLFSTALLSGVGGANTNYTLLAGQGHRYINGFTNVSLRARMGAAAGTIEYWNLSITNISGTDRTIEFSPVTNRWRFAGTYGTNAPSVLTNGTALEISAKSDGTNTQVGYSYFAAP